MTDQIQLGHNEPQQPDPTIADNTSATEEVLFDIGDRDTPPPALQESAEQPEAAPQEEVVPTTNAILQDPIELPLKKPLLPGDFRVSLPSFPLGIFTGLWQRAAATDKNAMEAVTRAEWQRATDEMSEMYMPGGMYSERLQDPTSQFRQGLLTNDGELQQFAPPKHKAKKPDDKDLRGELALLKVSRALGQGEVQIVPLPHSGINVAIKPPGERAVINFYNTVFREKIGIGRMTAGLTLTNFSTHINNRLFEFILEHVHSINYGDIPKSDLRKYLKLPDFYILATGMAAAQYPNGFEFQRPCISEDAKCDYIAKGLINLSKLYWLDNTALTEVQKKILLDARPGILTKEHYNKYQLDHTRMVTSSFTVKNEQSSFKFHMRVPTFEQHVEDGMAWINQINGAVDAIIVTDGDEEETRTQMLQQYVKSSTLRQFSHYIDYIEIDDEPIVDRETLNKVLELLSADDVMREELFRRILKYKSDTTIAIIGIPSYKCPNCHAEQNTEPVNQGLVDVIPLDVMNLFFTLLTLRMSRILER